MDFSYTLYIHYMREKCRYISHFLRENIFMMLTQFNFGYNTNKKNMGLYGKCEICFYCMHKFTQLWKIDGKINGYIKIL